MPTWIVPHAPLKRSEGRISWGASAAAELRSVKSTPLASPLRARKIMTRKARSPPAAADLHFLAQHIRETRT